MALLNQSSAPIAPSNMASKLLSYPTVLCTGDYRGRRSSLTRIRLSTDEPSNDDNVQRGRRKRKGRSNLADDNATVLDPACVFFVDLSRSVKIFGIYDLRSSM